MGKWERDGTDTLEDHKSASKTSPSVFPLSPQSATSNEKVAIACLVQGFFPSEPLNVTWNHSGEKVTVTTFPPIEAASGGLYTLSSELSLPAAQCPDTASFKCQVQQDSSSVLEATVPCKVPDSDCPCSCCQPRLSLHRPALEDLLLGSDANLTCTLSGLKDPNGATFTWQPSEGKEAVQSSPERDSCGCFSVSSVLPGCAEPWKSGKNFSCSVTHPEAANLQPVTIFKNTGSSFRPQVHLLPPPAEELALNELVTLTCLVRGFSPKDVLVRWLHGSQQLPQDNYVTWPPRQEPGQSATTFAVTSVLRVDANDWKQGDNFSCMVGHEALPLAFTQKTIDRLAGKPTHVNVSVVMAEVDGTCY